jgi:uncharacterized membrane protein YoaK (UPF0700 family)
VADAPQKPLGQRAAASLQHPLTRALLALTFTTGFVDGVSYLGLGHVFAANMTGNIVLLGFGIAGGYGLPVLSPIVAAVAFLVGAGAGGVLAMKTSDRHPVHAGAALAIEVALLIATTIVAALSHPKATTAAGDVVIALLALAMGVRNATVRKLAVPDLTTTVLTMTLTGLAADSRLAGGNGKGSARRVSAVAAMLLGALSGALLLKISITVPLIAATVLTLVTALLYVPAAKAEASAAEAAAGAATAQ